MVTRIAIEGVHLSATTFDNLPDFAHFGSHCLVEDTFSPWVFNGTDAR